MTDLDPDQPIIRIRCSGTHANWSVTLDDLFAEGMRWTIRGATRQAERTLRRFRRMKAAANASGGEGPDVE